MLLLTIATAPPPYTQSDYLTRRRYAIMRVGTIHGELVAWLSNLSQYIYGKKLGNNTISLQW